MVYRKIGAFSHGTLGKLSLIQELQVLLHANGCILTSITQMLPSIDISSLMAWGFNQSYNIDYSKTFSLVTWFILLEF